MCMQAMMKYQFTNYVVSKSFACREKLVAAGGMPWTSAADWL